MKPLPLKKPFSQGPPITIDGFGANLVIAATGSTNVNSRPVYAVISGLLPAVSETTLISDISAGSALIGGVVVEKSAATSHTYTASKDTYVDITKAGVFTFTEASNGGAVPAVAQGSLRLAKVVTDADNITGVTDLRRMITPS
jgi:hypothetical protein